MDARLMNGKLTPVSTDHGPLDKHDANPFTVVQSLQRGMSLPQHASRQRGSEEGSKHEREPGCSHGPRLDEINRNHREEYCATDAGEPR